MPGADKTLLKILERIKPAAKPKRKLSQAEEDLAMIAEELVAALGDGSSRGVADALRAAFGCMSEDKAKKYAEGGMVDDEEYDDEYEDEPTPVVIPSKEQMEKSSDQNQWSEDDYPDESLIYVGERDGYEPPPADKNGNWFDPVAAEENPKVYQRNVDEIGKIAGHTGSFVGEYIDDNLLDVVMGDPQKYVEVRSNPEAYQKFQELDKQLMAEADADPDKGYDMQKVYDMLYDPEFWKSIKTSSFNDQQAYIAAQQLLAQAAQQQLTPEQQAAADAQRAVSEGRKPKLVELRDEARNLTVLTDKPGKAIRKNPTLTLGKPTVKRIPSKLPRTIQTGPLR